MAVEWSEGAWEGSSKGHLEKAEKDVTRMKLGGCSCHADNDGCAAIRKHQKLRMPSDSFSESPQHDA